MFKNKRVLLKSFVMMSMAAALILFGFCTSCAPEKPEVPTEITPPESISIATGVTGGTWYGIGAVLAEIFRKEGVPSTAEIGGGASNAITIDRGEAELGMVQTIIPELARQGKVPFEEKYENFAGVGVLFKNFVHILVTKESGVTSIEELKGKEFVSQPVGQGTQVAFSNVLQAYGLSEEDLLLARGSQSEGAALVKDRHAIGLTATTAAPGATLAEMALFLPMRFLEVSDDAFEKLVKINSGYVRMVLPAGTYPGQEEDVLGLRTDTILIVNTDMPEEEVYWITKTLVEHIEDLQAAHSSMADLTVEDFAAVAGLELHPGARKYFEEIGVI